MFKGCSIKKLGQVSEISSGYGFPKALQGKQKGDYPFGKVGVISNIVRNGGLFIGDAPNHIDKPDVKKLRAKPFPPGTIVFAKIGEAIRQNFHAVTTREMLFDNNVCGVIPNTQVIDPMFLLYFFGTIDLYPLASTTAVPSINKSVIESIEIPVPSLSEQHHIVARIKECMEKVDEINQNSTSIDEELSALFPAMLNEKFAELAKDVPLVRLEDVADIKGGCSLPNGSTQDTGKDTLLLVKVGDMNEPGNERTIQVSRAYLPKTKVGNKLINPGAVIFPKRGGAIATNKKRLLGRPAMIDPNLMAVMPRPGQLLSEYLYYWTQTLDLTDIANGGVIPQLNRKDLAPLEIPMPDLRVQEFMCNELEQAEKTCFAMRSLFDAAYQERQRLREAILRKAFAGEL